jgi:hypothetical protein
LRNVGSSVVVFAEHNSNADLLRSSPGLLNESLRSVPLKFEN